MDILDCNLIDASPAWEATCAVECKKVCLFTDALIYDLNLSRWKSLKLISQVWDGNWLISGTWEVVAWIVRIPFHDGDAFVSSCKGILMRSQKGIHSWRPCLTLFCDESLVLFRYIFRNQFRVNCFVGVKLFWKYVKCWAPFGDIILYMSEAVELYSISASFLDTLLRPAL